MEAPGAAGVAWTGYLRFERVCRLSALAAQPLGHNPRARRLLGRQRGRRRRL
jgi:hypothetical protein